MINTLGPRAATPRSLADEGLHISTTASMTKQTALMNEFDVFSADTVPAWMIEIIDPGPINPLYYSVIHLK